MPPFKFTKGYSQWGAQMGRASYNKPPQKARSIRLFRVDLVDGYDNGGAYWGNGQSLWCAMADEDSTGQEQYRDFIRADSRREAMKGLGLKMSWLISKKDI